MKLTVLCIYPVFPPNSGYKNRCFFLYQELAKFMTVEMVSLTGPKQEGFKKEIASNLWEIRIPKSIIQSQKETDTAQTIGVPKEIIYDMTQMFLFDETPEFVEAFKKSALDADIVVATQPFFYTMIEKYTDKKFVYDSHNVEYILKQQLLKNSPAAKYLLDALFENEKKMCEKADFVTVCTANRDDAKGFEELFEINPEKIHSIQTCVDLKSIDFISPEQREINKKQKGYDKKVMIFVGSAHRPNIEACDLIIEMAKKLPEIDFLFVGTCCNAYKQGELPFNVILKGAISNEEKNELLSIADTALNPILTGSGVNVKVLDYIAAGIPVITTSMGTRGLGLTEETVDISDIEDFVTAIKSSNFQKVYKARKYIEETFDWQIVAEKYKELLEITK